MIESTVFLSLLLIGAEPSLRRTPVVDAVEKAGPAVVNVGAEIEEGSNPFRRGGREDDLWREFFGSRAQPRRTAQSLGSGVIIDRRGLVLTNEHVVARASTVRITLSDRRTLDVDVVAADPAFDIAVLRVRGNTALPVVALGTSGDLMAGESVIAIGNPFGLTNTVTTGVVSALHRSVQAEDRSYEDFIQTDAAINPGNSGGALLNIEGKLIGINTAIHSGGTGIGFAIPIDKAVAVVEEVLRYGEVRPVDLGVNVDAHTEDGALVRSVDPGSPGDAAGLLRGDRIVDVGGQQVADGRSFAKLLHGLVPGQQVALQVLRGGKTVRLVLKARELTGDRAAGLGRQRLGFTVKSGRGALVVASVDSRSPAGQLGIRPGDVVLSIAGRLLRTEAEFDAVCAAIRDADAVALLIGRSGRRYYATLVLTD